MKNSVVVIAIIFSFFSFGQNNTAINFNVKKSESKIDTAYISDISDKLIIKLNRDYRIDKHIISDELGSYTVQPNGSYNHFVSIDYRFFGFSIGLPRALQNENADNKEVKTTNINLGFSFFINKWMYTFHYNQIKGYYVKDWKEELGIDRNYPNLTTKKMGGSVSYIMNGDKFSYRSFSQQTQIQKKSAGSFISTIAYEYTDQTDVIKGFVDEYSDRGLLLSLLMSYQYNLVLLKNLSLSGGVSAGGRVGHYKTSDPEFGVSTDWEKRAVLNFNFNLNYQYKKWFVGLQVYNSNAFLRDSDLKEQNSISYQNIYIGYQFNAPKKLEKPVIWLEEKLF